MQLVHYHFLTIMTLNNNNKLTKTEVLELTKGGISFYSSVIPNLQLKDNTRCRPVLNPLYYDTNPSLSIYYDSSKEVWRFYDHGDNTYCGDVFNFAALYFKLDIKADFNLILNKIIETSTGNKNNEIGRWYPPTDITEHVPVRISLNERKSTEYTQKEIAFWNVYGIDNLTLDQHKVVAIDGYSLYQDDDFQVYHEKPVDQIWFAYKWKNYAKIYQPSPKRFWYIGVKTAGYQFGTPLDMYPEPQKVILTGGEKDALALIAHGFNAICLNSETAEPSETLLRDLYKNQMMITGILYDLDDTGVQRACDLSTRLKCPVITLPKSLLELGGKDVSDFFKFGGTVEELQQLIDDIPANKVTELPERKSVRTAQQRLEDAKNMPEIQKMLDVFLHSGELAILFGDTGIGKSILAVAIADAVSRGVELLSLENQSEASKVIYYDFELSDKQFEKRYSNSDNIPHKFSDSLFTDNVDFSTLVVDRNNKFEKVLLDKIRLDVMDIGAKLVIIDNLTFLTAQTASDVQVAMEIMKLLKQLKSDLNITILVLAHTTKIKVRKALDINDLAGSKQLSNFADTVFAVGVSAADTGHRYIKQIKPSRSGELKYDQSNVLKCELLRDEQDETFLTFQFIEFCKESSLLGAPLDDEALKEEALKLRTTGSGATIREIGTQLGVSKSKVGRWLQPN
jgi:archaellum biogenesis ATPase FlaH